MREHPDHDLFGSLPGAGPKLAPRLLAELGDNRQQFESAQALQGYAGTAPVSYQSGPVHKVRLRGPCDKALRATVYLWVDRSRHRCPWANNLLPDPAQTGQNPRVRLTLPLASAGAKILWKMWQTGTRYDAELHQKNQLKHGSWVLKLQTA